MFISRLSLTPRKIIFYGVYTILHFLPAFSLYLKLQNTLIFSLPLLYLWFWAICTLFWVPHCPPLCNAITRPTQRVVIRIRRGDT